jgi:hypothetical protein
MATSFRPRVLAATDDNARVALEARATKEVKPLSMWKVEL